MTQEPTFKLTVELTATQIEAMASLIEGGADDLRQKIASEPGYTVSDIANAERDIRAAQAGVETLKKAHLADCREILGMFGLGYQDAQEKGQ